MIVKWYDVKKVVRISLVVMKDIRHGNLYTFPDTMATGDGAIGTSENEDDTCECTRL